MPAAHRQWLFRYGGIPYHRQPSKSCQFGKAVYDVIIGLCESDCHFYREQLGLEIGLQKDDDPTDWDIAFWLRDPMPGREEIASRFVRFFLLWTRAAIEQLNKREAKNGHLQEKGLRDDSRERDKIDLEIEDTIRAGDGKRE